MIEYHGYKCERYSGHRKPFNKYLIFNYEDEGVSEDLYEFLKIPIQKYVENMGDTYESVDLSYIKTREILLIDIKLKIHTSKEQEAIVKQFEENYEHGFRRFYEEEKNKFKES
jgi:flagellar biosynthesis/type III secretory pathway protein FliH